MHDPDLPLRIWRVKQEPQLLEHLRAQRAWEAVASQCELRKNRLDGLLAEMDEAQPAQAGDVTELRWAGGGQHLSVVVEQVAGGVEDAEAAVELEVEYGCGVGALGARVAHGYGRELGVGEKVEVLGDGVEGDQIGGGEPLDDLEE